VPNVKEDNKSSGTILNEDQFYKYNQIISQQQVQTTGLEENSSDSAASFVANSPSTPVNLIRNTLKADNFYDAFNNGVQHHEEPTRSQNVQNVQIQTTTVTFTTSSSSPPSSKKKKMKKKGTIKGARRGNKYVISSETEESDEYDSVRSADGLNISIEEAYDMLAAKFPPAPVLMKMGSLWAVCEMIRQDLGSV